MAPSSSQKEKPLPKRPRRRQSLIDWSLARQADDARRSVYDFSEAVSDLQDNIAADQVRREAVERCLPELERLDTNDPKRAEAEKRLRRLNSPACRGS